MPYLVQDGTQYNKACVQFSCFCYELFLIKAVRAIVKASRIGVILYLVSYPSLIKVYAADKPEQQYFFYRPHWLIYFSLSYDM